MRIVRVNLTNATVTEQDFNQKDWWYYGGRAIIDKFVTEEVDPQCDPLGPGNILVFANGYFVNTAVTTSGRLSVGGKSPLTGGFKESNAGGTVAKAMADQAIKAIILEGQPETDAKYIVYVAKDGTISLLDGSKYWGMENYPLGDALREDFGPNLAIASIGPGGERKSLASGVFATEYKSNYPCRAAARGGLGAVMGSKGVKAVVIDKAENPWKPVIPEEYKAEFMENVKKVSLAVTTNPMTGDTQRKFGSAAGVGVTGMLGALPVNNFSGKRSADYVKLAPEAWFAALTAHGGRGTIPCQPGCVVSCSNEFRGSDGKYLSAGIEYETLALCGSNLGIFNPEFVATVDRFCDDYGVDTIDIGAGIGVAMDCGVLPFGDEEGALKLLNSIKDENDPMGRALLNGCQSIGEYLGAKRIPTGKRQALAAYDPRVIKGFGLTFERSPMGADHTSGSAGRNPELSDERLVDLAESLTAACDNYVCLFAWGSISMNPEGKAALARCIGILSGEPEGPGPEIFEQIGMRMLYAEHSWNKLCGFKFEDDKVGDFFYEEPAEATGAPFAHNLKTSFLDMWEKAEDGSIVLKEKN